MKIYDILYEGLRQRGDRDFGYERGSRASQDPWFDSITNTKLESRGKRIVQSTRNGASQEEIEELKPHIERKGNYQTKIPTFFAFEIYKSSEVDDYARQNKTGRGRAKTKRQVFLDALKGRAGTTFPRREMNDLINDASAGAVMALKEGLKKEGKPLERYGNIIVIPIPSSNSLVKRFAGRIVFEIKQYIRFYSSMGANVQYHDILMKNPDYDVSRVQRAGREHATTRGKPNEVAISKMLSPRPTGFVAANHYAVVVDEFAKGRRSAKAVEQFFQKRFRFAKQKLEQAEQEDDTQAYVHWADDIASLEQEYENFHKIEQSEEKADGHAQVHGFFGGGRELVWNLIIPKNPEQAKKIINAAPNTLVILVDDNIDRSKSLVDAYRSMYKTDVVGNGNDRVVAVMMHTLK